MIVKEFDAVKLKNGSEGTILEVFIKGTEREYLFESDKTDDEGHYPQSTIKEKDIEKVIFSTY